jgi:hypothetical protein
MSQVLLDTDILSEYEAVKNFEQCTMLASRGRKSGVSLKVCDLHQDGKPRTYVAGLAASVRRQISRFATGNVFTASI